MVSYLEPGGYRCITAGTYHQALMAIDRYDYYCVVVDLNLPDAASVIAYLYGYGLFLAYHVKVFCYQDRGFFPFEVIIYESRHRHDNKHDNNEPYHHPCFFHYFLR